MKIRLSMLDYVMFKIISTKPITLCEIKTILNNYKYHVNCNDINSSLTKLVNTGFISLSTGISIVYAKVSTHPKLFLLPRDVKTEFLNHFGSKNLVKYRIKYIKKYFNSKEANPTQIKKHELELTYLNQLMESK